MGATFDLHEGDVLFPLSKVSKSATNISKSQKYVYFEAFLMSHDSFFILTVDNKTTNNKAIKSVQTNKQPIIMVTLN